MADELFIDIPVVVDAQQLADNAVANLQQKWPDWVPDDGDLEVVQIETLAPMAVDAAETAAQVPSSIFRSYGTKLLNVPYDDPRPATATLVVTVDAAGYVVPPAFEVDVDGWIFATDAELTIPPGSTTGSVLVTAREDGAGANGLGATVSKITALAYVVSVAVNGVSSGGTDGETDEAYQNRMVQELQLWGRSLVTLRDYELLALLSPLGIGRVVATVIGNRHVRVTVTDATGEALSPFGQVALLAEYQKLQLVNTQVDVEDATYTTLNVTYAAVAFPGFDPTAVKAQIDSVLSDYLTPRRWGTQPATQSGSANWVLDNVVRRNKVIGLIGSLPSVNYVESLTLAPGPDAAGNVTLAGAIALPRLGVLSGTVTT